MLWRICRDSKILSSVLFWHVPIISICFKLTWGPLQERRWSRIWDWGGWERGLPVRTLTPACSAVRVARLRVVDPTYWAPHSGQLNLYTTAERMPLFRVSLCLKRLPIVKLFTKITLWENWEKWWFNKRINSILSFSDWCPK